MSAALGVHPQGEPHDIHIDFHSPEHPKIRHSVYAHDHVRVDVGPGLSMYLDVASLVGLREQLYLAEVDLHNFNREPLLEVWDDAVANA